MEYVKTTMIDRLFHVLAPHRCSSCGEIGMILCECCKYDIVSEPFSRCVFCTRPCGSRGLCASCGRRTGAAQAWCVGERRDGLRNLLDAYKFASSRVASSVCADLFDAVIPKITEATVVGIPSTHATVRVRGFDHMGRIADDFAGRRGLQRAWPLERASSVTLHFLPRNERIQRGSSLFRLSSEPVPETVLLLDDIVTTGTTLTTAIRLLKNAGAKKVYVAAIARQPEHD